MNANFLYRHLMLAVPTAFLASLVLDGGILWRYFVVADAVCLVIAMYLTTVTRWKDLDYAAYLAALLLVLTLPFIARCH